MTIDEAISHALEVAEEQSRLYSLCPCPCDGTKNCMSLKKGKDMGCTKCAADHRQLAEWLTELKQWRRVYGICPSYEMCIPECREGYDAQIAEHKRLLKLAVDDLAKIPCNNDVYIPSSCDACIKQGNCDYTDSFKWRYADEALKLLND